MFAWSRASLPEQSIILRTACRISKCRKGGFSGAWRSSGRCRCLCMNESCLARPENGVAQDWRNRVPEKRRGRTPNRFSRAILAHSPARAAWVFNHGYTVDRCPWAPKRELQQAGGKWIALEVARYQSGTGTRGRGPRGGQAPIGCLVAAPKNMRHNHSRKSSPLVTNSRIPNRRIHWG